jgi:beta-barrel assembly-enhancing protease
MPMRQFTALFHDRTDQKTYNARVECTPGVLFIRLDTEMGPQTLEWVLADIQDAKAHDDGSVILQSGRQFLEVQEAGFEAALSAVFPKNKLFRRTFFDKIGVAGCILSILIAVLPFLALYWWGAPYLADRAARKVPKETETEIGEQLYQQMTATYTVDSVKTRLVQDFFRELGYPVSYPIHITVVKEPVVNAFAIPGGHIVVFDSILHLMDAPEQLAALLGHEASHVELRHSTRSLFRQLANSLVISIFMSDSSAKKPRPGWFVVLARTGTGSRPAGARLDVAAGHSTTWHAGFISENANSHPHREFAGHARFFEHPPGYGGAHCVGGKTDWRQRWRRHHPYPTTTLATNSIWYNCAISGTQYSGFLPEASL